MMANGGKPHEFFQMREPKSYSSVKRALNNIVVWFRPQRKSVKPIDEIKASGYYVRNYGFYGQQL